MKITSGKFSGVPLYCPDTNVRPTLIKIRQAVFNIIRDIINNSIFIDLFSGTGAFGFEAISNGAEKVYFIDVNNKKYLSKNAEKLKLGKNFYDVIMADYRTGLKLLKRWEVVADIIFADPPYNKGYLAQLLKNDIIKEILNPNGMFIIEVHKKEREKMESFLNCWKIYKEKKYGDTYIIFFNLTGKNEQ